MQSVVTDVRGSAALPDYDQYEVLLGSIRRHFDGALSAGGNLLFTTDATGLFEAFLGALASEERQHYTCHTCRQFVERYGGLVTIAAEGFTRPAMWFFASAPEHFQRAISSMERLVHRARVTGVFYAKEPVWGTPETGPWHHWAVTPPAAILHRKVTQTPFQSMAEKHQDYGNVCRALAEFPLDLVHQAVRLLNSEALYRSEAVLGPAEWLQKLHETRATVQGEARNHLTWLAVAKAPAGFCHPRASMIGSLLEDLAAGMPFETVKRRFDEKMRPTRYQRPEAPPTAGNIAQAEKVVAELGAAGALQRRYARVEEIASLWRPRPLPPAEPPQGGVFGHLVPKDAAPRISDLLIPPQTMTWAKFRATVLPTADRIEFWPPSRPTDCWCAMTTAADPEAPPILQWDQPHQRNPFAWYLRRMPSTAPSWGLSAEQWARVTAITLSPPHWGDEGAFSHLGTAVILVLEGARDQNRFGSIGLGLFPGHLKADFHGIRATIEAFSEAGKLEGREEATACGFWLQKGQNWQARLRVTSGKDTAEYILDRWD